MQKTEYGICYSFNSASSEEQSMINATEFEPRRTTSFNVWSGFRSLIRSYPGRVQKYNYPTGVLVIVHHPYEWPQQAKFIPEGTGISIGIQPTAFYASSDVRRLTSTERQCIYNEEVTSLRAEIMNLQGLPYLRANCMAECRQRAMMAYCNCILDLFYPSGEWPLVPPVAKTPHRVQKLCQSMHPKCR
ncbi:sodium channel protein Nach-like [Phlebotomus papatasi]|uniref:sodium channel protein Nach-like n=1 Tax=Phlebotomus papatasi TaxID=29031 RepID=UPI002483D7D2|nr:sodium channel protein Nach-like [Phlebotomus papatasi]